MPVCRTDTPGILSQCHIWTIVYTRCTLLTVFLSYSALCLKGYYWKCDIAMRKKKRTYLGHLHRKSSCCKNQTVVRVWNILQENMVLEWKQDKLLSASLSIEVNADSSKESAKIQNGEWKMEENCEYS